MGGCYRMLEQFHNEELYNLYSSSNIKNKISRRWAGHVARKGAMGNVDRLGV
jgi:hypothetical protein